MYESITRNIQNTQRYQRHRALLLTLEFEIVKWRSQRLYGELPGGVIRMLRFYFIFCFFLILNCEAIGTAATPGLLCQPRVIVKMIVEKQMECGLAG
jgi:hypothetical protein